MTYCVAWKSNEEIYIIGDSITSSKYENSFNFESAFSSMGEEYGKHGSLFVGETDTKIFRNHNIVVAFSGIIDNFSIIKERLGFLEEVANIDNVKNILEEVIGEDELIIGIKNEEQNFLFHFSKAGMREIFDFISIGSGGGITDLNNLIREFSNTNDTDDVYEPRKRLSAATAYLQILSLKNNFLSHGIGGTFCGICIHDEIEWNDDFLYFMYNESFSEKKLVNVIIRKNTIITGSDFTELTKLFKYGFMNEDTLNKMSRFIRKNIASYIPRYIIFYSYELNNIYFYDTYRQTHTGLIRMYQRRGKKESKTELFTSPILTSEFLLSNKNEENMIVPFHYLESMPVPFISRNELIENVENVWDVEFEYDNFDYPLENFSAPIEIKGLLTWELDHYENIIIINIDYLKSKLLELSDFYSGINIEFNLPKVIRGIREEFKKAFEINNFKIILFSDMEVLDVDRISDLEIHINKSEHNFTNFTNSILLEYFKDHDYYHMDKVMIVDDSSNLNEMFYLLPDYNRVLEEADVFLIKNQEYESQVLYPPYYYNADTFITNIVGLPHEALGWWSPSEMSEYEKEEMAYYINSLIKNSSEDKTSY